MLSIEIKNKIFKQKTIIENFKININKSEFISIIGPSGCGKTTLLKIISQLDTNFKGSVLYDGKKYIENLGFIFQDSRLLPWLSVEENIMLVSKEKNKTKIHELLTEVGLGQYIHSYPKELSGGMQRRVSMVRAFINKPEVLLLDEPFISLDYPNAQSLRKLFFQFYEEYNPTVILVTHDLNEALSLSNKILFLSVQPTSVLYEYSHTPSFDEKKIMIKKEEILTLYPNILKGLT